MWPLSSLPSDDLTLIEAGVGAHWDAFQGARIFVTGGTGFFGKWLLESFVFANRKRGLGATMVVLARDPRRFLTRFPHLADRDELQFCVGDVVDFEFPNGPFTHIIHAATPASAAFNANNPLGMCDVIVRGMSRVLELVRSSQGASMLFTSSGAVYGQQPLDLQGVAESYVTLANPNSFDSAYAFGKWTAEKMALIGAKSGDFSLKIARGFAFVGPHLPLDTHFAIGNFIRDGLAGGPILVNGNPNAARSYLYGTDLAIWLWVILSKGRSNSVYNVGSGQAITILELAQLVGSCFETPVPAMCSELATLDAPPFRYVPDIGLISSELGVTQGVDLRYSIQKTILWSKQNGTN